MYMCEEMEDISYLIRMDDSLHVKLLWVLFPGILIGSLYHSVHC